MVKLKSKEDYIKMHREMWNWIADNIKDLIMNKHVKDILEAKELFIQNYLIGTDIRFNCFCCEYAIIESQDEYYYCNYCPLNWNSKRYEFMCEHNDSANWYKANRLSIALYSKVHNGQSDCDKEYIANTFDKVITICRNIASLEEC